MFRYLGSRWWLTYIGSKSSRVSNIAFLFYDTSDYFRNLGDSTWNYFTLMSPLKFRMMIVFVVEQLIFKEFHKSRAVSIYINWTNFGSFSILREHFEPPFYSFRNCVLLQIINNTNVIHVIPTLTRNSFSQLNSFDIFTCNITHHK